jgi:hypothetical protein
MPLICSNCGLRTRRRPCPECASTRFVPEDRYRGEPQVHDDEELGDPSTWMQEPPGNWFDGQARCYSDWMLWVHLLVCQGPGLVVGLCFVFGCRTSVGKHVGKRLLLWSGAGSILSLLVEGASQIVQHQTHP